MASSDRHKTSLQPLLHTLLAVFSNNWLTLLPELLRLIQRWWGLKHPQGMYEILSYDSTLELCDAQGKLAVFRKQQRVKFLQDNVLAFPDWVISISSFRTQRNG